MENDILYETACLIYPGCYVPLLKEEEVNSALTLSPEGETILLPVNLSEFTNFFKVELPVPGVKREDILVHSDGNVLSVYVLHKKAGGNREERFQLHEFNYDCFSRHIILPVNADPEFANAEYKEGMLRLFIPKTEQAGKKVKTEIAVY
jgi:HSP20 family protein